MIYKCYNELPNVITSITCKLTFYKHLKCYLYNPNGLPSLHDQNFKVSGLLSEL